MSWTARVLRAITTSSAYLMTLFGLGRHPRFTYSPYSMIFIGLRWCRVHGIPCSGFKWSKTWSSRLSRNLLRRHGTIFDFKGGNQKAYKGASVRLRNFQSINNIYILWTKQSITISFKTNPIANQSQCLTTAARTSPLVCVLTRKT